MFLKWEYATRMAESHFCRQTAAFSTASMSTWPHLMDKDCIQKEGILEKLTVPTKKVLFDCFG
jgi:hypothetical protein